MKKIIYCNRISSITVCLEPLFTNVSGYNYNWWFAVGVTCTRANYINFYANISSEENLLHVLNFFSVTTT